MAILVFHLCTNYLSPSQLSCIMSDSDTSSSGGSHSTKIASEHVGPLGPEITSQTMDLHSKPWQIWRFDYTGNYQFAISYDPNGSEGSRSSLGEHQLALSFQGSKTRKQRLPSPDSSTFYSFMSPSRLKLDSSPTRVGILTLRTLRTSDEKPRG